MGLNHFLFTGATSCTPLDIYHTISTYRDIQMKGIEFLRNIYIASGFSMKPRTRLGKMDALEEIICAWGLNPEEILTKQAFAEPHITVVDHSHLEENQIHALSNALKQQLLKELREDQHEQKSVIKL